MQPRNRDRLTVASGFTLLELMVTLGVVAVVTAVAIPAASSYYKLARKVDCQASVIYFLRAQDLYYLDHNKFYKKDNQAVYSVGWNPGSRPDQVEKYGFPALGVEFRPDTHRGYRIQVVDINLSFGGWSLFYQGLRLELRTDEDFSDQKPDPELYTHWKYNTQSSWAWGWGTSGEWEVGMNTFWFDVPSAL
jgi:prepilin-type N-terminal cleavage/methylation domain-containing protein